MRLQTVVFTPSSGEEYYIFDVSLVGDQFKL